MPGLYSKETLQTEIKQIEHKIPISNSVFPGRQGNDNLILYST